MRHPLRMPDGVSDRNRAALRYAEKCEAVETRGFSQLLLRYAPKFPCFLKHFAESPLWAARWVDLCSVL